MYIRLCLRCIWDKHALGECSPKALRTTTSEVVLLLGQKQLGSHVVVVF